MITVNNLSVQFTGVNLFDNVSFVVGDRDRIGLVGKNGAGKSTLLKILANLQERETGTIIIPDDQSVGYLPQEKIPSSKVSVFEETMTAFVRVRQLEDNLKKITSEIERRTDYESSDYEKLLNKHFETSEYLNLIGANNAEGEAEKVLLGLGFERSDFERKLDEFSSGWQMRVELAKILLQKPNFILLDEPTNHLDIESIEWLENFLVNYFGAVVLVSHDRTFLDNITKRTIEITSGKIYDYKCPYSQYVIQLQERRETQASILNNQQKQIAEIEKFIEKFRYKATKAKQVQSRIKLIEKMELESVDEIDTSSIHFKFPPSPHSGKISLEINHLYQSYGDNHVLNDVNIIIKKGEKIAFVGKNGEGKSTLAKIIVGQIDDFRGECKLGHQLKIGYFAQNQAALLDGELTVFETIDHIATGDSRSKIRSILGSFLFDEDDIEKKVKVLSGGEKSRLALAKLILSPINCLVLDEPTNHLDMDSKDILKTALIHFDGTLILVSHDRDFLQGLTDNLYEFRNRTITEFKGDIFEYLEHRKMEDLKELEKDEKGMEDKQVIITENKINYEKNKEFEREIRKIKNQIQKTESEIESLEKEIEIIDQKLSDSKTSLELLNDKTFFDNYQSLKDNLQKALEKWEELSIELETKDKV